MIEPNTLDWQQLFASLKSTTCPACGRFKKPMQTLCASDYRRLSKQLKKDLYKRLGEGYEEAVHAALNALDAAFHKPRLAD